MITIPFRVGSWRRLQKARRRARHHLDREAKAARRDAAYLELASATGLLTSDFTGTLIREEGFFRQIMPPVVISNAPPPTVIRNAPAEFVPLFPGP